MSTTFTIPNAPYRTSPCPFCQEEWVEFPEGNGRGGKCDRFCTGTMEESEAPEVNLSEGSVKDILSLLGLKGDAEDPSFGSCDVALFRRRIMLARNTDRSHLEVEPCAHPGGHAGVQVVTREDGIPTIQRMGARYIEVGNTDEQTLGRLARLDRLAQWAQERGIQEITWA